MQYIFASLLAFPSLIHCAVGRVQVGEPVKTTIGQIVGHASSWQPTVSEYLGIPFAVPPVGPLRWKAPQPYKGDGKSIAAAKFSPDCPSNIVSALKNTNKTQLNSVKGVIIGSLSQEGSVADEDCLTLNVWTKPGSGEKAKAVLVWIYGGGFAIGNTASPMYNGARLAAEQDVVVVSMNYRINIFGFPSAPGLADQNLGLLDQRLAVEWVRDNIAAFGGDPKRITLFGESAGGASVDMYTYAWTKDPIANAFIAESGTVFMSSSDPASDKTLKWYKASQNLGCGGREAGGKTVDCMRSKPWKAVIEAIKPTSTQGAALGGMGDFGPHADGKVVFSDYKVRAAAGNFIKRPLLVGNNANEAAMFAVILGETTGLKSPALQLASAGFSCPAGDAAKARIDNKVKAWRYVYSGEWPNQDIASGVGAYHGSEIGMVFGTTEYMQTYFSKLSDQNIHFPDTPNQKTLMKTMMTAWASFAKDPENALGKLGWPVYDSSKATIINLGGPGDPAIKNIDPKNTDAVCKAANGMAGLAALLGKGISKGPVSAKGPKF